MTLKQATDTDFIHRVEMQDYPHKPFDMFVDRLEEVCPRGYNIECSECDRVRVVLNSQVFTPEIPWKAVEPNYCYCLDIGIHDIRPRVSGDTAYLTVDDQVIATEDFTFGWESRLAEQFTNWVFNLYYKEPN